MRRGRRSAGRTGPGTAPPWWTDDVPAHRTRVGETPGRRGEAAPGAGKGRLPR